MAYQKNKFGMQLFWSYIAEEWEYDKVMEDLLEKNNPFRKMKNVKSENTYF